MEINDNVTLNNGELKDFIVHKVDSLPTSATNGKLMYKNGSGFYGAVEGGWEEIGSDEGKTKIEDATDVNRPILTNSSLGAGVASTVRQATSIAASKDTLYVPKISSLASINGNTDFKLTDENCTKAGHYKPSGEESYFPAAGTASQDKYVYQIITDSNYHITGVRTATVDTSVWMNSDSYAALTTVEADKVYYITEV